jgi:ribosomal protein S18 acetylase RimI-like enzyme
MSRSGTRRLPGSARGKCFKYRVYGFKQRIGVARSDVGVVAQVSGTDAGACWVRLLPMGVGLASVDADTPQLGIALEPAYQHKGYGRLLMLETLKAAAQAGYKQVSLTVHPENPAQYMYESCGFRKAERRNNYHLMVASAA